MKPLLDIHCHTIASGHAYGTISEYVQEAAKTGLELLAVTDHGPAMPNSTGAFYFTNFCAVPEYVDGIRLMLGAELNILNVSGEVDLDDSVLSRIAPVIASLHPPCFTFSGENLSEHELFSETTETLLNVMANRCVQIIGHPGDARFPFDIEKVVRKSRETGTLLEINNSSLLPTSYRKGAREIMLKLLKACKKLNCPIVLGSDAHFPTLLGKFSEAFAVLEEAGFPEELVLNTDTKRFLSLLK